MTKLELEIVDFIPIINDNWNKQTTFVRPEKIFAIHNNNIFLVIEDKNAILRLMSMNGSPFMTPKASTTVNDDDPYVYHCKLTPHPLNPNLKPIDKFVNDDILTVFPEM